MLRTPYKAAVLVAGLGMINPSMVASAPPPLLQTPEEKLWEDLSSSAEKNLASEPTLKLMENFLRTHSSHSKVANVRYMYGEREFKNGNFQKAAVEYEKFLALHKKHPFSDSALFRLGECYYNLKAYNSALFAWDKLVKEYKSSALTPRALEFLAYIQMHLKEWGKADELFQKCQRDYPVYANNKGFRENYGIVQYQLRDFSQSAEILRGFNEGKGAYYRGLSLFELKLFDEAIGALANVAKPESGSYAESASYLKAEGVFQKKNYNLAASEFALFNKQFPSSALVPYAELRRAICSLMTRESEEALKTLDRVLKGSPSPEVKIHATFCRASALLDQKSFGTASELFEKVSEQNQYPDLAAIALLRQAWAYKNLKQKTAFNKSLKTLEEKYPVSSAMAMGRFLQGVSQFENNMWEEAGVLFESAILRFPYSPLSEVGLALMVQSYTRADRLDQLVTAANSALKLFEKNYTPQNLYWRAQSYYFIGKAYFDLKRFKEANPFFEKVTIQFSDHALAPGSQLLLAWSLCEDKKFDSAREKARVLIDNIKINEELRQNAQYLYAITYFNAKDYDQALKHLSEFLTNQPQHDLAPRVRYLMGLSHYQKKTFGSAIEEWNKLASDFPNHP